MRILIVDDEDHLRRVMRITLEAAGYDVEEAADGESGLRAFADGTRFDAILLDQRMPGLDGLETLGRMKAIRADVCVIMVTAYATIELAVDAMKLGATDFVRKPMTPETLRQSVAAALNKRAPVTVTAPPSAPAAPAGVPSSPDLSPAEVWTTNGFFLRRVRRAPGAASDAGEHRFVVRRGADAAATEIVVSIEPKAMAKLARECRREFAPSGSFWSEQAERALVNYLWSEAKLPDKGRLTVDTVSGRMIDAAMSWSGD
jgi:DNA-binding response OmpR family regulator